MDLGDGGVLQSVVDTYEILGFEKRERSQLFQKHLEEHLIEVRVQYIHLHKRIKYGGTE